ncbi:MAG: trypsin-like peptidase domain-containing protein [Kordiimonadaceae bacterium]|nr:trypsin-like peptidase domain-containing protein [Kordiimonadaceae bacterium]
MSPHLPHFVARIVLLKNLLDVNTSRELATFLKINYENQLIFHAYRVPSHEKYLTFEIPKKSGGTRRILAPATALKLIQRSLAEKLLEIYKPRASTYGFCLGRGVVDNAKQHLGKRVILNVDFENFFPSINFGRVRGLLMAKPYSMPKEVATIVAQICCHDNQLPQGAPTSPVVSNMICRSLDRQLQIMARKHNCWYTRYVDDITISTNRRRFPPQIAQRTDDLSATEAQLGEEFKGIVENAGFNFNPSKTRILTNMERKEVTGVTINEFPNVPRSYVRQIRAMLHAWEHYGFAAAQEEYIKKYQPACRNDKKGAVNFEWVVRGKLEYLRQVRGTQDPIFIKQASRFNLLASSSIKLPLAAETTDVTTSTWIVQSTSADGKTLQEGTAFFLEGVGLVTCEHCIIGPTIIFSASSPTIEFPVVASKKNAYTDVAILNFTDDLQPTKTQDLRRNKGLGDNLPPPLTDIRLIGYPNWALGAGMSIRLGRVTSINHDEPRYFQIDASIISGNSGGPVLDAEGFVLGMASRGAPNQEDAQKTNDHRVVPIQAIFDLCNQ